MAAVGNATHATRTPEEREGGGRDIERGRDGDRRRQREAQWMGQLRECMEQGKQVIQDSNSLTA